MLDAARCPMPECSAAASAFLGENQELRKEIEKKLGSGSHSELPLFQVVVQGMKKKKSRGQNSARVDFGQSTRPSSRLQKNPDRDEVKFDEDQSNGKEKGRWRLFGGKGK